MSDPTSNKTHLQRINMPSLVEGESMKKSHITNIFNNEDFAEAADFDSVKNEIQPNQVREEGLGPININNISNITSTRPQLAVRSFGSCLWPPTSKWTCLEKTSGEGGPAFKNSVHPTRPQLHIPWNPETDTHVVIRCSGFVSTYLDQRNGGPSTYQSDFMNRIFQLGLNITGPLGGTLLDEIPVTAFYPDGMPQFVWPYTTIRLNDAFSRLSRAGFLTKAAGLHYDNLRSIYEDGGARSDAGFQDDVESVLDGEKASFYGTRASAAKTYFPKGTWEEHLYDRRSGMQQSFMLIAHASSDSRIDLSKNSFQFTDAGTIKVRLMGRVNGKGFTVSEQEAYLPRISNLEMSASVYGR
jgi:hypothetical protein